MMNRTAVFLAVIAVFAAGPASALYRVNLTGDWPASWPKELEPLRKQSRTLVGPLVDYRHYAIPFTKREDVEAAWPHLLKVRSKGAPIVLVRGPNFFLEGKTGLVVHSPPAGQAEKPAAPEAPISAADARERMRDTTYIELVVDGAIVDLNRLPLPADTPIIDERFKDGKGK